MAMFNDVKYVSGDENLQVPAHLNFGKFLLHRLKFTDDVAFENADTGEKLTYRQLKQYAVDLAVALTQLGVAKGDVVAFGSERRNEYYATALAIFCTGATYTPIEVQCGRSVLRHKLNITQPKYLICSNLFWETNSEIIKSFRCVKTIITLDNVSSFAKSVQNLTTSHCSVELFEPAPVLGQVDTAFVLYSSGTTGMPKGVRLTHLNCIRSCSLEGFSDESLKTALICNSWQHDYDTFMIFVYLCLGRKIVYISEDTKKLDEATIRCLETHKIVNPESQEVLGPNQQGEIRVRGPAIMRSYIGIEMATILDNEGFYKTGDLGYYEQDGYFYIVDRLKEIISYDGYQISPVELETVLMQHPDVREAGVVGKPVPVFGEEPVAFVVRQYGSTITEQQLFDFVNDEVAPYMQLRGGIRFVSQIPRNLRGKIIRSQLRQMLAECC